MTQPTGFPGGGLRLSKNIVILTGSGNPNNSATPDVQTAQQGSIFIQEDGPALWFCTTSAVLA